MSRYVHVPLAAVAVDEVCDALAALGIAHTRGEVMLRGSLECTGEPVLVRIDPAPVSAIEDLGVAIVDGAIVLVCGELDRDRLHVDLVPRLVAAIAERRIASAAARSGLQIVARAKSTLTLRRK